MLQQAVQVDLPGRISQGCTATDFLLFVAFVDKEHCCCETIPTLLDSASTSAAEGQDGDNVGSTTVQLGGSCI